MAEHRGRTLDVLPLVDVMMVILFALVTTQEADLSRETERGIASAQRAYTLQNQVDKLQHNLAKFEQTDMAQSVQLKTQLDESQNKFQALLKAHLKLKQARWPDGQAEPFRRDNVLKKLLEQNVVIEIEITGRLSPDGLINYCCFRNGPRDAKWRSCGQVPSLSTQRTRWLDKGGEGLLTTLRATGGGHPITIIRQDITAAYTIGDSLEQTIRSRFSDHTLYNDGVQAIPVRCGTIEGKTP